MHTIILTRGIYEQVEMWKTFMQAQMFNFPQTPILKDDKGEFIKEGVDEEGNIIYKKGTPSVKRVQGALRPMQLWEYVYPEECHGEFLAMLQQHKPTTLRKEMLPVAWTLRKAMHLTKVPLIVAHESKESWEITDKFIPTSAVATYLIGSRKDKKRDFLFTLADGTKAGFYQEGL